jgi:hypothetical protein
MLMDTSQMLISISNSELTSINFLPTIISMLNSDLSNMKSEPTTDTSVALLRKSGKSYSHSNGVKFAA